MKKHQALQAELAGHEPRINNVSQQGSEMINDGHFAAEEIQDKISDLDNRWIALKVDTRFSLGRYLTLFILMDFLRHIDTKSIFKGLPVKISVN